VKRSVGQLLHQDVPASHVAWDTLLENSSDTPVSFQPPKVCVSGLSELGEQLAHCLSAKAGLVDLAVHDVCPDALAKYQVLPVRLICPFLAFSLTGSSKYIPLLHGVRMHSYGRSSNSLSLQPKVQRVKKGTGLVTRNALFD
jgi:hypothetical protein